MEFPELLVFLSNVDNFHGRNVSNIVKPLCFCFCFLYRIIDGINMDKIDLVSLPQ